MSGPGSLRGLLSAWACSAVLSLAPAALFLTGTAAPAFAQSKKAAVLPRPPALPTPVLQRLAQMTPEQRQKALARLAPERRERLEQQLNKLDQLPPEQKARVLERYDAFQGLPRDRQGAVRAELQALRKMPVRQRRLRLNSPEFEQASRPKNSGCCANRFRLRPGSLLRIRLLLGKRPHLLPRRRNSRPVSTGFSSETGTR